MEPSTAETDHETATSSACPAWGDAETSPHPHLDSIAETENSAEECGEPRDVAANGTGYSGRQILTLVLLMPLNFLSLAQFMVLAPFYPPVAKEKGVSAFWIGAIFGVFQLTKLFVSPVIGKMLLRTGCKHMLTTGMFVTGAGTFLYGFLDYIADMYAFAICSFLLRVITAVGSTMFIVASNTMLAHEFSDQLSLVMGYVEMTYGLSVMVSPLIGGLLYKLGGFCVPFYVFGTLIVLQSVVVVLKLPRINETAPPPQPEGMVRMLAIPDVVFVCAVTAAIAGSQDYFVPTLAIHLNDYGLQPLSVGAIFTGVGILYMLFAPLVGLFANRGLGRAFLVAGTMVTGFADLFVGPSRLLHLPPKLWITICGLTVNAVGWSLGTVPLFATLIRAATSNRYEDNLETRAFAAAIISAFQSLGAALGPIVGGVLVEKYGFRTAVTCLGLAMIGLSVVGVLYLVGVYCFKKDVARSNYTELKGINDVQEMK